MGNANHRVRVGGSGASPGVPVPANSTNSCAGGRSISGGPNDYYRAGVPGVNPSDPII